MKDYFDGEDDEDDDDYDFSKPTSISTKND